MYYAAAATIALAAILQAVNANYDLYRVGLNNGLTAGTVQGWQAYPEEANCDIKMNWVWLDTKDASGVGVRCEGSGCVRSGNVDSANIDVLEMNFLRKDRHWTYYKDRGGALVAPDGTTVGKCYPFPGPKLECGLTTGRIEGWRKLRCELAIDANDINLGKPK